MAAVQDRHCWLHLSACPHTATRGRRATTHGKWTFSPDPGPSQGREYSEVSLVGSRRQCRSTRVVVVEGGGGGRGSGEAGCGWGYGRRGLQPPSPESPAHIVDLQGLLEDGLGMLTRGPWQERGRM